MKKPPCFDSVEQYREWMWANRNVESFTGIKSNYCNDCLPGYQARMISESRCNHPKVSFVKLGIKAFYGRRPRDKAQPDE